MFSFLPEASWPDFVAALSQEHDVFLPAADAKGSLFYQKVGPKYLALKTRESYLDRARTIDPIKSFFFSPLKQIGRYFPAQIDQAEAKPFIIIGAPACDLAALAVLDQVFQEGEYADPVYQTLRDRAVIISHDCQKPTDFCFCPGVGGQPYPKNGFDINISRLADGYLLETATEKGQAVLSLVKDLLQAEVPPGNIQERDERRAKAAAQLKEINQQFRFPDRPSEAVARAADCSVWDEQAKTCVQCGGCNYICPTCYCFTLQDREKEGTWARHQVWDGCILTGYARMAGGANPRPSLGSRYRNRFNCKFIFSRENYRQLLACVGCGRCLEVCPGKIDMRQTLQEAEALTCAAVKLV